MDVHFDSLKCPRCPRLVVLVPIAAIEVAAAQLEVSELRVNIYSLASFLANVEDCLALALECVSRQRSWCLLLMMFGKASLRNF